MQALCVKSKDALKIKKKTKKQKNMATCLNTQ